MTLSIPALTIQSVGDHYQVVDPDHGPAPLKDELAALCRERFRRIDRYTQLALIGSGRCVGDAAPASDTGLYIGSRFASLSNTVKVHEQMVAGGIVPKPAHFINTLSNSAGYYVARNLGLTGRNLFVSRQDASLLAALQLAALDLAGGAVSQALVGVVDESAMPLDDHCRRLGVPRGTPLGEGSHWFKVILAASGGGAGETGPGLGRLSHLVTLQGKQALADWAEEAGQDGACLWWTGQAEPPGGLPQARYQPGLVCYPAAIGGAIVRYLESDHQAPLLLLTSDGAHRYHGIRLTPPR